MRTNIEIDDSPMARALAASRLQTKRAVVEEEVLRVLIRLRDQQAAFEALGGIGRDGDLAAMREG